MRSCVTFATSSAPGTLHNVPSWDRRHTKPGGTGSGVGTIGAGGCGMRSATQRRCSPPSGGIITTHRRSIAPTGTLLAALRLAAVVAGFSCPRPCPPPMQDCGPLHPTCTGGTRRLPHVMRGHSRVASYTGSLCYPIDDIRNTSPATFSPSPSPFVSLAPIRLSPPQSLSSMQCILQVKFLAQSVCALGNRHRAGGGGGATSSCPDVQSRLRCWLRPRCL